MFFTIPCLVVYKHSGMYLSFPQLGNISMTRTIKSSSSMSGSFPIGTIIDYL